MHSSDDTIPHLHDVIIIGAGPCGLSVAARLRENTPSAIFTDEEHQRYHWIRRHGRRMSIMNYKNGSVKTAQQSQDNQEYSILILDSSGNQWMSRWNHFFRIFKISHLRSPMFFHVDPHDRDALLAYTYECKREDELAEIRACVGKEISKHQKKKRAKSVVHPEPAVNERDRKDYFTPSSSLFSQHCASVVDRYSLKEDEIKQEAVLDIDYDYVPLISEINKTFSIKSDKGVHYARAVVLAVGAGNTPSIPGHPPGEKLEGACHAMEIRTFPDPTLKSRIDAKRHTNIVVVGGVKPFDLSLPWIGKFRNYHHSTFWTLPSGAQRHSLILSARDGGSITPPFHKKLRAHIANARLSLHTHTTLTSRTFNPTTRTWRVETEPPIPTLEETEMDYIYFATGIATDVAALPYLRTLRAKHPVTAVGGLPVLTPDLAWAPHVPLFVTGKLAALELGPGAANLAGARSGAERVVWGLSEVLEGEGTELVLRAGEKYVRGVGGRFECLGEEGEDSDILEVAVADALRDKPVQGNHAMLRGIEKVVEEVLVPRRGVRGWEEPQSRGEDVHVEKGDLSPGVEGGG
ncbi:hypothetical protein M501DRAFT_1007062 [Patellaria atrata CBS 101060]|uniref:FAD/NAD(P)-binding domain-containing protein n=1 Tax=Patellaria atrata CBS 101060 TaxID=1346257 RepID=A0A9P4S5U9_9PEZI|nr:hypothetical protein M501DRAFT_1007062 [Patellaria atrata CBS 101060]